MKNKIIGVSEDIKDIQVKNNNIRAPTGKDLLEIIISPTVEGIEQAVKKHKKRSYDIEILINSEGEQVYVFGIKSLNYIQ